MFSYPVNHVFLVDMQFSAANKLLLLDVSKKTSAPAYTFAFKLTDIISIILSLRNLQPLAVH